jgi:hypothetical protein
MGHLKPSAVGQTNSMAASGEPSGIRSESAEAEVDH